jgi:leucyl-tRNA synthetase
MAQEAGVREPRRIPDHYDHRDIDNRWRERWAADNLDRVTEDPSRPKFYCLEMFPYPSGEIHMGHARNYIIGDVIARFRRMQGYNVLHPMGWDAFGMPAENAAIKSRTHPADWTYRNIEVIRTQMKRLGISYDWDRDVASCHPGYYKWTQWLFLLLLERGLAYRKRAAVNWCPSCATVLANEQVVDGQCWRCESVVTKKELEQWFFRITAHADRLLEDLALLKAWPERVRTMQEHWIGRSEGVELKFGVKGTDDVIPVFTTRQDTLFGVTFLALAPDHPLVRKLVSGTPYEAPALAFVEKMKTLGEIARTSTEREKEGMFIGAYAVNPVDRSETPIWIADYVLMEYGTGAVMGVPAHDQRDFEFVKRMGLPLKIVIQPDGGAAGGGAEAGAAGPGAGTLDEETLAEAYIPLGRMVNSGPFNGLVGEDGRRAVAAYVEERGTGRSVVNYRLRDWLISRQRYWGAPIPVVYCGKCGVVPVPVSDLPVRLPEDVEMTGAGSSPLGTSAAFVRAVCPSCGGSARRETDTMDTFVCSSWYYLRFCSPRNEDAPFTREALDYWMPVDQYTGGIEHAILHLLYSRFIMKVLADAGYTRVVEPFSRLLTQGMVMNQGVVMSKSKGTGVAPEILIERYGADTARLFTLFSAPPERDLEWNEAGVEGCYRFLNRVWRFVRDFAAEPATAAAAPGGAVPESGLTAAAPGGAAAELGGVAAELRRVTHRTIHKVTADVADRFAFNTAISSIMELVNAMYQYRDNTPAAGRDQAALAEAVGAVILLLAPFASFLCEELWVMTGHTGSVHRASWPSHDPALAAAPEVEIVVQVNGRIKDRAMVPVGLGAEELSRGALEMPRIAQLLEGREVVRVIAVPGKLVNIVLR